jgi:hypothetical protein
MKDFKEHYTTYFEPNKKLKTYMCGVVQAIKVSQLNVITLWNNFIILFTQII